MQMICMYSYRTKKAIDYIANEDHYNIQQKIENMIDYISYVSRYSYKNRYYSTMFFMEWLLKQNVKDIHMNELKNKKIK
jgi:hypothetical protein